MKVTDKPDVPIAKSHTSPVSISKPYKLDCFSFESTAQRNLKGKKKQRGSQLWNNRVTGIGIRTMLKFG